MKSSPFIFLVLIAFLGIPTISLNTESLVSVQSPGGKIRIELVLKRYRQADAVPHLRVYFRDRPIILDSRLGINLSDGLSDGLSGGLSDGQELGGSCFIDSVTTSSHHEEYAVFPGKRSRVLSHYTEAVVALREQMPPGRRWELALRAYDDGVAFRYRIPAQDGWSALVIRDEKTEFAFPRAAQAYVLPLNSFTTSYEKYYQKKLVAEIPGDWLIGLPLLLEIPGSGWAAVTEAALTDYAGMYLARPATSNATSDATGTACLISRLSPLPKEPGVAVRASLPHDSPWRVIMIAEEVGRLIESDLVLNLNEPVAIPDTSWIRTGKTTFPWWNGYHLENVSFQPGLNTATMMHYIDFCARNGIPYHSLDGLGNVAWYGGPINPYKGADITKALPEIDLPAVIAYARKKGVRLRLWMHWEAARAYMDRAFPLYHSWGIEGVMIDFMDRDDQEMINFRHRLLQKAAENQLTVTFHGVSKPTGLERTYPNLLTSEGVLNLEYNKWDKTGCTPEHQLNVAFTRMLAGPLDFHQGSFRGISVEKFKPRNIAPFVMGTPSRTLASYVVYQNHLSMVADYPEAYQGHPGLKILAEIPTSWDDTRFLSGSVGEYIVIARRRGAEWYVGAMCDNQQRTLEVPLKFLDPGRYRAEIYLDDEQAEYGLSRRTAEVAKDGVLKIRMEPAGGYLARIIPK